MHMLMLVHGQQEAVRLKEKGVAKEVTAVSLGPAHFQVSQSVTLARVICPYMAASIPTCMLQDQYPATC